jgi:hypothetical protein
MSTLGLIFTRIGLIFILACCFKFGDFAHAIPNMLAVIIECLE